MGQEAGPPTAGAHPLRRVRELLPTGEADPRFAELLRRTGIDSLPQLFNVLRGDMSLVGPRPARVGEAELFEGPYRRRFRFRPGVTGLWRLARRGYLTPRQSLDLDVEYVDQQTFLFDLGILVRTVGMLVTGRDP